MFQNYYNNCICNLLASIDQIKIGILTLGTVEQNNTLVSAQYFSIY